MVRFIKAIPLLLVIILLAGIASVASAQSSECEAGSTGRHDLPEIALPL